MAYRGASIFDTVALKENTPEKKGFGIVFANLIVVGYLVFVPQLLYQVWPQVLAFLKEY